MILHHFAYIANQQESNLKENVLYLYQALQSTISQNPSIIIPFNKITQNNQNEDANFSSFNVWDENFYFCMKLIAQEAMTQWGNITVDENQKLTIYNIGSSFGSGKCLYFIGQFYKNDKSGPKYEKAYRYFEDSTKNNCLFGYTEMAKLIEEGLLGPVNLEKVVELYSKATHVDIEALAAITIIQYTQQDHIKYPDHMNLPTKEQAISILNLCIQKGSKKAEKFLSKLNK